MNSFFTLNQIVYSLDASSLIEAHHTYPRKYFPSLWDELEVLVRNDRLKMSELVLDEVKDEEIKEWYEEKQLKPYIRVTIDKLDQNKAKALIPIMVNPKTGESGGDPWVIALAQDLQNGIVVTQEKASRNEDKPKIPNICKGLDIELVFLKSTQNPLSINDLSIRGYENAKKCSLIDPYYVKKTPCFQYKIK